jgi:hypothetical protein
MTMNDDDRLPPLPPFAESLLEAERRRPPPTTRERRALWRRARRSLIAGGFLAPALAAGKVGAALATKIVVAALVVSVGVSAALQLRSPSHPAAKPASHRAPVAAAPPNPPFESGSSSQVPSPRSGEGQGEAAASAPDPDALFKAEAALIDQARAALARHDPHRALTTLARHERRFPTGVFEEEREALRVRALALDGQRDDARAAADRFRVRFPRSLFRDVVERALP